jgi:hypothetical protein
MPNFKSLFEIVAGQDFHESASILPPSCGTVEW